MISLGSTDWFISYCVNCQLHRALPLGWFAGRPSRALPQATSSTLARWGEFLCILLVYPSNKTARYVMLGGLQ
jgi:hypothetical protein